MSLISPQSLLLGAVVAALVTGCAHGGRKSREPAPNPEASDNVVKSEDIDRSPGESIEKILQGRVAGVHVTRAPDGGIAIRIRGQSTILGNDQPLYVVDGVPVQPGPGGSLTGINPYDIATIEVLKDVASTSMYGVRGANGVILIKTKRPSP